MSVREAIRDVSVREDLWLQGWVESPLDVEVVSEVLLGHGDIFAGLVVEVADIGEQHQRPYNADSNP